MKKIDQIMEKLRKSKPAVEKKYGVKNMEIFGSYLRGEQTKGSDLDILVEFYETIDLFKYIAYAIEIGNVDSFQEPIDPYLVYDDFKPPQSFYYLYLDFLQNLWDVHNTELIKPAFSAESMPGISFTRQL